MNAYHTYRKDEVEEAVARKRTFNKKGHWGTVWNVENAISRVSIPPKFYEADVLYSEPAWPYGYEEFMKRAVTFGLYSAYKQGWLHLIHALNKPTFLVCDLNMLKYLGAEHIQQVEFRVGGSDYAHLGIFNHEALEGIESHRDVLNYIAQNPKYDKVLDPCCGYGSILEKMLEYGKKMIISDVNAKCVGYCYELLERQGLNG